LKGQSKDSLHSIRGNALHSAAGAHPFENALLLEHLHDAPDRTFISFFS
jgi:hypothetical protein